MNERIRRWRECINKSGKKRNKERIVRNEVTKFRGERRSE